MSANEKYGLLFLILSYLLAVCALVLFLFDDIGGAAIAVICGGATFFYYKLTERIQYNNDDEDISEKEE